MIGYYVEFNTEETDQRTHATVKTAIAQNFGGTHQKLSRHSLHMQTFMLILSPIFHIKTANY